jgi:hypothetical protein
MINSSLLDEIGKYIDAIGEWQLLLKKRLRIFGTTFHLEHTKWMENGSVFMRIRAFDSDINELISDHYIKSDS